MEVYAAHADRLALIKPFDPDSGHVAEQVAVWAETPGVVGARVMMAMGDVADPAHPGLNAILAAGARHGLPVNIFAWGHLPAMAELASRNPDTQLVLDHLGLKQPFEPPPADSPFADLDNVLALAKLPNVAIKISGACTLAREPFPYPDIWDPLCRIFDAFGLDRCLWGTDWTRAVEILTYQQGVEAFLLTDRLSGSDREMLMGGSLTRIYGWKPVGPDILRRAQLLRQ